MSKEDILALSVSADKVLVVDDKLSNRLVLEKMIASMGMEVILASDGIEAIEKFKAHLPGLVLMDIVMPRMDGINATRELKTIAGNVFIPVIMVSGLEDEGIVRNAIEAGGDDFIRRPFSFEILRAKVTAMQRISHLYRDVQSMYGVRKREEEVAEQIFSEAVERANVATDEIKLHKRPAATFSGDVLLTARRPNGDINILLGDFTGHGLTSVVGALPLAETFRAMTSKGYEAEEVLGQINRKLNQLLPTGMFLAASMVTLTKNGRCLLWNGGMPDILVVKPSGEVRVRVESNDPPLGIIANLTGMHITPLQIEPDERILLISDGVVEARNDKLEYFGEERFLAAVLDGCQKNALLETVVETVDLFLEGHEQDDDISLIEIPGRISDVNAVKRKSSVGSVAAHSEWSWLLKLHGGNLKRINPVAIALSQLQELEGPRDNWQEVFTVLTELYVNALDHGVLKLPSSLKDSAEGFSEYFVQRESRLDKLGKEDFVLIKLKYQGGPDKGKLTITVIDSGTGFDVDSVLAKVSDVFDTQISALKMHGRGIGLVRELCTSLRYEANGSAVVVEYDWQNTTL